MEKDIEDIRRLSSAVMVWQLPEMRRDIFSYIPPDDLYFRLTLNRSFLPEAAKALYRHFDMQSYQIFQMKEIDPIRRFQYLSAVQHLDITGSFPALHIYHGIIDLFTSFPNLRSVTSCSVTIKRSSNQHDGFWGNRTVNLSTAVKAISRKDPFEYFWKQVKGGISIVFDAPASRGKEADRAMTAIRERKYPFDRPLQGFSLQSSWMLDERLVEFVLPSQETEGMEERFELLNLRLDTVYNHVELYDYLPGREYVIKSLDIGCQDSLQVITMLRETKWEKYKALRVLKLSGQLYDPFVFKGVLLNANFWIAEMDTSRGSLNLESLEITLCTTTLIGVAEVLMSLALGVSSLAGLLLSIGGPNCSYAVKIGQKKEGMCIRTKGTKELEDEMNEILRMEIARICVERDQPKNWGMISIAMLKREADRLAKQ